MAITLGSLGKKIWETLGQGVDRVVPGDQSYLYKQPPQQAIRRAANSEIGRAAQRGPMGLLNLGMSKAAQFDKQLIGGFEENAPEPIKPAVSFVNKNIINPNLTAFQRVGQAGAGQNPYSSGRRGLGEMGSDAVNLATWGPLAVAKTGSLGVKAAKSFGLGAPIGVAGSVTSDMAADKPISLAGAGVSGAVTGGLNTIPVVGPAAAKQLKAGYKASPTLSSQTGSTKLPEPIRKGVEGMSKEQVAATQVAIDKQLAGKTAPKVNTGLPEWYNADITPKALEQNPKGFKEATNAFLGGQRAASTLNTKTAMTLPKLQGDDSLNVIRGVESGVDTGDTSTLAPQIRQVLDAKFKQLQDAGVDIGYLKNYFPHRWANPDKVADAYAVAKQRSGIQNDRVIPTLDEGIKLGFKPQTTDYRQALKSYLDEADRLLAGREYVKRLQNEGLLVAADTRPNGMKAVTAPGLPEGNWYASPGVAQRLDRIFSPDVRTTIPGKAVRATAQGARVAQDVVLAGGVPGTPLNAFGFMQGLRHLMGGSVRAPLKAGTLGVSRTASNNYFKKNAQYLAELQSQGSNVSPTFSNEGLKSFGQRVSESADKIARSKGKDAGTGRKLVETLKESWRVAINDSTFGRFVPILQTEMYKNKKNMLMRFGVPEEEAIRKAASATMTFEGTTTLATTAARSKTGEDVVTSAIMAPKYRESMINFWVNNVKSLYPPNTLKALNPRDGQYRSNLVFTATSFASLYAMNEWNKAENDGRNMWENPPGKEDKVLVHLDDGTVVGVPWLSSIAFIPRTAVKTGMALAKGDTRAAVNEVKGFGSLLYRPMLDVATNEDYFGNKIRNPEDPVLEQAKDAGGYLASAYQHPYLKAALRSEGKSGLQVASEGLELPFRFYKESSINNALKDKEFSSTLKGASNEAQKAFAARHPGANEFGEYEDLADNPAYSREKAVAFQNPELFALEKRYAELENKYKGKPIDPLFNLPEDQRKKVLWKTAMVPGSKDPELSNLYKQEWFVDYQNERDKYYKAKKDWSLALADKYEKDGKTDVASKIRSSMNSNDNPYPETPPDLQKAMDAYSALPKGTGARSAWIRANGGLFEQMKQQWAAVDNWQNAERVKLGLDATEGSDGQANGYSSGSSKSYSKGGSSGGGSSKGSNPYQYAVSINAGGKVARPKVSVKKTGGKIAKAKKVAGPKVKTKKSMV